MNLTKVLLIFGKKSTLAKKAGVTNSTVSLWASFNKVPDTHVGRVKSALKAYRAEQNRAYQQVMK